MLEPVTPRHTVEKIGGTSIANTDAVLKNVFLREHTDVDPYNRIFVVSAYAGMTDKLLEHKKTGAPGVVAQYAGAAGKPYDIAFLGLAMNSGTVYGVNSRGPNAAFTRNVLKDFLVALKGEGVRPIVCNTIHMWPETATPAGMAAALVEGQLFSLSPARASTRMPVAGLIQKSRRSRRSKPKPRRSPSSSVPRNTSSW